MGPIWTWSGKKRRKVWMWRPDSLQVQINGAGSGMLRETQANTGERHRREKAQGGVTCNLSIDYELYISVDVSLRDQARKCESRNTPPRLLQSCQSIIIPPNWPCTLTHTHPHMMYHPDNSDDLLLASIHLFRR